MSQSYLVPVFYRVRAASAVEAQAIASSVVGYGLEVGNDDGGIEEARVGDDSVIDVAPAAAAQGEGDYTCPRCEWSGAEGDLDYLDDVQERVSTGEFHPAGQCPSCRALIEARDVDVPGHTLRNAMLIAARRSLVVEG